MAKSKAKIAKPSAEDAVPDAVPVDVAPEEGRHSRYANLIPPEKLARARALIVGTGAVGRQAAIQLCSMGIGHLRLVDFDDVSKGNLGPQGWFEVDVGQPKVAVLKDLLLRVNPECQVEAVPIKFEPAQLDGCQYVLACADNMDVRKDIVDAVHNTPGIQLTVDTRMGLEICRTYHIFDEASLVAWRDGWFPQSEGHEAPCGMKATIYCASVAGAMATMAIARHVNGRFLPHSFELNMQAYAGFAGWPAIQEEVKS